MKLGMIIAAAIAAIAASGGSPAQAQTLVPESPSLATTAPDPVRMSLARQVQEASGGEQQAEAQMKSTLAALQKALAQALPPDQSRLTGMIYDDLGRELIKLAPRVMDVGAQILAENYTERELRDMLAFQTSESGRSIARKSAAVHAEMMTRTMPLVMAMMPAILQRTGERVCEEAHCTSEQRKIVAAALAKAMQRPAA